jgi:glycosyltransferase involved in cell wall biosynthesis
MVKKKFKKPDIVHLNIVYPLGIWAYWLKKRYKIPYVITENSTGLHVGGDNVYPKHILKLCKFILRNSDFLLPVSQNLKSNMKLLSPKSRFSIISNVADATSFSPNPLKKKSSIKNFIHISTANDRHKNISGLLRVLAELSKQKTNFHFNFVSDGDYQYAIDLAKNLALDEFITFHSTKTTEEISQMIQDSDALVLFSNYENFPCVIAESFMCGVPVVSTNVNGIPEHVNSDNGILVNRGDESALLKALLDFIADKFEFNSDHIRNYAMKYFSYEAVSLQFNEVYEKVLNR